MIKKSELLEAIKTHIDKDGDGVLEINELVLFVGEVVQTALFLKNVIKK